MTASRVDVAALEELAAELGRPAPLPHEMDAVEWANYMTRRVHLRREANAMFPHLVALVRAVEALADDMKARGLRAQSASRLPENANIAARMRSRGLALSGAADQLRSAVGAALNPQETGR